MDLFSIKNLKRCVDCNKRWLARPENNPENKHFRFDYVQKDYADIYAKTETEAIEEFESKYEYDDYDIEEIKR